MSSARRRCRCSDSVGVLPGEHLPGRQVVQFHATAVAAQRPGGGERVDRQRERAARVVHGQQVAAGLVVDDDELGAVGARPRPRPGVEPVDPPGYRDRVGPRRHRPLDADRLVGRVEPADVLLHQGPGPVPVAGRLRLAGEPLADPALASPARPRPAPCGAAAAAATSPPARCAPTRRRCCAPTAAPWAGPAGPGSSSGSGAGSRARSRAGSACTSTAAAASPRNRAVPWPGGLAELARRPGRHPAVEPLGGVADGELLAVAGQHPGARRQVEQPLADRGELAGEVGERPRRAARGRSAASASPVNTTSSSAQ